MEIYKLKKMEQSILIKISLEELKKIIADSIQEALQSFHSEINLIGEHPEPRSVNLETICKIYNWKKATVYGWVHDSFIPHSKVGKRLYFNIPVIEQWIALGRRKTISEMAREADRYMIRRRSSRS